MKIIRIYNDLSGESHFDEHIESGVEFRNSSDYSRIIEAHSLVFKESSALNTASTVGEWHVAPRRQYVLFLKGNTEIEVSDGEKRIIKAGDVLLVEDTEGKGHRNLRLTQEAEVWAFVRAK